MNSKKTDRRVKYTKTVLADSLIALLQEKTIDRITVKELCEAADLNRSTFYAHFRDPFDLFEQIERDLINGLNDYLSDLYATDTEAESREILTSIFEYIIANAAICKVLLGEHGDTEFIREVLMIVQRRTLKEWGDKIRFDADMFEYSLIFNVYGCLGIIRMWLKNGLDKTASEMSNTIIALTFRGLLHDAPWL